MEPASGGAEAHHAQRDPQGAAHEVRRACCYSGRPGVRSARGLTSLLSPTRASAHGTRMKPFAAGDIGSAWTKRYARRASRPTRAFRHSPIN